MISRHWRWISASVRGTSHLLSGTECQDSHLCVEMSSSDGPILAAFVSDGAGSAKRSAEGSKLLCEILRDQSEQYFAEQGRVSEINSRLVAQWIEQFRNEVILLADGEGISDREFACTVLGALIGYDSACFFQVGDGAIVYSALSGGPYRLCFWPNRGEYENTTYFATQPTFCEQLQFKFADEVLTEVALLSDGLQRLALNYQTQEAHEPFFRGLFASARSMPPDQFPSVNEQLSKYLDSPKVNERTDDDKTLILAISDGG
jgi:hypothetical protein